MAKIQNIGVGNYIRNPQGRHGMQSRGTNVEVLKIEENHGNSFLCYPISDPSSVPVTLDKSRYLFIPIDTDVQQVSV